MKKIIRLFFLSALTVGILSSAQAQRGRDSRGGGGGNTQFSRSSSPSRTFSAPERSMSQRSAPQRSFNQGQQRVSPQGAAPERAVTNNRNGFTPSNSNVNRNAYRGNGAAITPQRNTTAYNTRVKVATRNSYNGTGNRSSYNYSNRGNNYIYHSYYGNVYGHRTVFMYGPRYAVIPRSFISINFGGYPYYYNNGLYYGYYNGYYQSMFPPFGLSIGMLPFGYSSLFLGGYPYYYYNGIYYRPQGDNSYQVVDAPMGATVSSLPGGARSVVVNGETLYELNGTYYKASQDSNGNNVFTVVGKNGVINNTPNVQNENSTAPDSYNQSQAPDNTAPSLSNLNIGDTVGQLPDGSKLVNINGEKLYETPDNVYLKGESNDGVVQFKVVGK